MSLDNDIDSAESRALQTGVQDREKQRVQLQTLMLLYGAASPACIMLLSKQRALGTIPKPWIRYMHPRKKLPACPRSLSLQQESG